jgi:hypothetical protein
MEWLKENRKLAIWIIVALLFLILNPSMRQFKDYAGSKSYAGLHRRVNLFIFSVYTQHALENESGGTDGVYIGILANFIPLKEHKFSTVVW